MKYTFTNMKVGKREESQGWVCEGEKRLGDREEHSLRAYSPLQCLGAQKKNLKKNKIRLSSEDDIEDSQGGRGWSGSSSVFLTGNCEIPSGTVYTFS